MTQVFIVDVSVLSEDIDLYKNYISEYRYEKVKKLNIVKQQLLGIGAELLLAKYLGRKPCYRIDEMGKPYGEAVEFNFSHSGNIAVCAVSSCPVGADVEKIRNVNMDIAKNKFSKKEYNAIINSQNPQDTFFEYWVKKESYVKALGMGLRIPLDKINVDEVNDWQFYTHHFDGYKLCVCSKEEVEFIEKNLN